MRAAGGGFLVPEASRGFVSSHRKNIYFSSELQVREDFFFFFFKGIRDSRLDRRGGFVDSKNHKKKNEDRYEKIFFCFFKAQGGEKKKKQHQNSASNIPSFPEAF